MDVLLQGLKWKNCMVYLDDIIVLSRTFEDHFTEIIQIFVRLLSRGICVKPSKGISCREKVLYLSHVISAVGLSTVLEKIKAVIGHPKLCSSSRWYFWSLLGTIGTLFKLSLISLLHWQIIWRKTKHPSTGLRKWIMRFTNRGLLQSWLIQIFLWIQDSDRCFWSWVRSSSYQKKREGEGFIQFASTRLSPPESRFIGAERACLTIIWVCNLCRPYVIGTIFLLETDNQAVSYMTSGKPTGKLARRALRLQEFHVDLNHSKGTSIAHVDALSRKPVQSHEELDLLMINEDYIIRTLEDIVA